MEVVYWILVFVFGGIIVLGVIIGEVFSFFDGVFEAIGNVFDIGHADLDTGDIGHEGSGGQSVFSFRTLSSFLAGFGAGGLIGKGLFGLSDILSLIPATSAGLFLAVIAWTVFRMIVSQQGSTSVQPMDYINCVGRVSVSIPTDGSGVVTATIRGENRNLPAVSNKRGLAIPYGAQVTIVAVEGSTVSVEPNE